MKLFRHIKEFFASVAGKAMRHKAIAGVLAVLIVGGGYYSFQKLSGGNTATRYVSAATEKGTLIVSVSGSGQVSAATQFDVKPKVSGDVVSIGVAEGQRVGAGALLMQLDSSATQKTVRDAEVNLESAQLSLEKLKLSTANVAKILEDAFADISSAFLDFPTVVTDAGTIILKDTLSPRGQANNDVYKAFVSQIETTNYQKVSLFVDTAVSDYGTARADYDDALFAYKNTSRYSDQSAIRSLLEKTVKSAKSLAQALKSEQNLLDFLSDYASTYNKSLPTLVGTYKSTLRTDIGQANSHLSALVTAENNIENAPLDIQSQELAITQRENALRDAKETLADYSVRAPFAGIVAKVDVKRGDAVSASAVAFTLITARHIAEISLNEVDIAKVKAGQKATLTFDAIPDLTLTGEVAQMDTIGTVSQGVVSYNVTVAFDAGDERVRPGMSVSAAIITEVKQNTLIIPNAAIKEQNGAAYVEIVSGGSAAPRQQEVKTGLANDTMTEILNGLNEGDQVVTQTITGAASQSRTQQDTGLRIPGIGGGFR